MYYMIQCFGFPNKRTVPIGKYKMDTNKDEILRTTFINCKGKLLASLLKSIIFIMTSKLGYDDFVYFTVIRFRMYTCTIT